MGVKCLWDILESYKKTLPLHHLQNKRVCIDLSCWMVQLQNVNKSHCAMKEKLYLRGLFHRIRALIALNCSLIFVTDGAIPAVKISTYRKRLNLVDECAKGDMNGQKVTSLKRNMGSEFSCMVREAKTLGMALGIPCLDGLSAENMNMIEEAEAQCALLNFESICDGCFSSDSDIFLFGARTVYRDICLGDGGYVVCYEMKDIENKLGLGRHSLIALALLLGSDYSHGVHGYGPESACQVIRSVGEDLFLQRIASEGVSFLKSLKSLKKHSQFPKAKGKENLPPQQEKATGNQEGDNEFSRVIDAYMKPKCHPIDSDHVYRVLSVYPFRRAELQHICDQSFGWPSEKTDEYILPRIAERELRKFANLRLSSSQFGVVLPLHEMPIKCPISEVLKRRRVHCKDCLEVSWEEFDGLKTSVVPADLVESACPEKIAEFEERIAQKKKTNCRKPRSKKSDDKSSSVAILDQKLQELLLEIECEDNIRRVHSLCSTTSTLGITSKNDSMTSGTFVRQYQSKFTIEPSVDCPSHPPTTMETDVVDLLSPWPRKSDNKTSVVNIDLRFQEMLSELESEENERRGYYPCSSSSATIHKSKITNESTSGFPSDPMDVIDLLSPRPKKPEEKSGSLCSSSSTLGMSSKSDSLMSGTSYNEQCDSKITTEPPTTTVETDMIDLLSPSPEPRARYVSNCKGYSEEVSVIDLSDSDVEMSPEHSQKAKELRVFLASIREEIH